MKWASMWMYVDLQVSADEMHAVPCRAQLDSTMRIFAAVRTAFPRKYPLHITSSLDDEAAGIRIPDADAVVTSSAGAGLISLLCPQHHRYR